MRRWKQSTSSVRGIYLDSGLPFHDPWLTNLFPSLRVSDHTEQVSCWYSNVLESCVQLFLGNIKLHLMFSSSSSMEGTLKVFYWNIQCIWTGLRDCILHEILQKGCDTFTKMVLFTEIWHQRCARIKTVLIWTRRFLTAFRNSTPANSNIFMIFFYANFFYFLAELFDKRKKWMALRYRCRFRLSNGNKVSIKLCSRE